MREYTNSPQFWQLSCTYELNPLFNKDGSGGIFPSLAGAKGMRGTYAGAVMLLLWKAEDEKVKLAMYRRPFGYTKVREAKFLFEGDNLVVQANNPVREIKADETNLHILFDLKKFYFRKVDPNNKAARKPKVLLPKEVKFETPEGFGKSARKHHEGFGGETVEYIKISDHDEKISLSFTAAYELAGYNRPGGKKATYDEVVAILIKGRYEKCMESYPKAKLSTGVETLDGIKAGYVEGLLDENSKDMKGPYYIKQYVLVDDGITMLTISILAKSTERIKFMDDYVKKIKLNMTKTWVVTMKEVMEAKRKGVVTMKEVMEAKRKGDEYMKKKSGK